MRLPVNDKEKQTVFHGECIDLDEMAAMVDLFLSSGFSYFDTARGYHEGLSEGALKKTLVDRYPRDAYQLASKLPAYLAVDSQAAKRMFFISLDDTQAGYFDSFLLHCLGGERTRIYEEFGIWDFLFEQKKQGLIRLLGFSFHDNAEELKKTLRAHPNIDFVQLQINYADWESSTVQGKECLMMAQAFGKPVVIMEPLKGGLLADPPNQVKALFDGLLPNSTPVSLALRFAASIEGISVVLSGMSSLKQMEQNVKIMSDAKLLSLQETYFLNEVRKKLNDLSLIPCTSCGYCIEICPHGIAIPQALAAMNVLLTYGDYNRACENYLWASNGQASACLACCACETYCPQNLNIATLMAEVASTFESL